VLKVLLTRRWLAALAAAAVFAVACFYLGRWQWGRHVNAHAKAHRITSHYTAAPEPLSRALPSVGTPLPLSEEWTPVRVTGTYDAQGLQLVRNRPNDGNYGYEVVVPLQVPGGALLVDRGWIDNAQTAASRPDIPATPTGTVTVTGWLRQGEPSLHKEMPTGQLASINLPEAAQATGTQLYGGYLIVKSEQSASSEPIARATPLAAPDTDEGPHLAYAFQWWLFGVAGFVLVGVGIRREADEQKAVAAGLPPQPKPKKVRIWDEEDA
jgi:cytochrome oxidase assembly protein ShyY1